MDSILNLLIPLGLLYFGAKLVLGMALWPIRRYFPEGLRLLRWLKNILLRIPRSGLLLRDIMEQFKRRGAFGFIYLLWKLAIVGAVVLTITHIQTGAYFIPVALVWLVVVLWWPYLRVLSWRHAPRSRTRLPGRPRRR